MFRYAQIIIPLHFNNTFDYKFDTSLAIVAGQIVQVPFLSKKFYGIVYNISTTTNVPHEKIKSIIAISNICVISSVDLKFIDWFSAYTMIPRGKIVKMILSIPSALEAPKKVLPESVIPQPNCNFIKTHLSQEQHKGFKKIQSIMQKQKYATILIDGITGSGKTEVYFEAIALCLQAKQQALVLLPEISLTPQFLARFQQRFNAQPIKWHSQISLAQRRDNWRLIAQGKAAVIVGARSALMLPYHNLGLIIVDEEHDTSYKQEEVVIYNARDMAIAKAKHHGIVAILASATPCLESYNNANNHKYELIKLNSRYANANLPNIQIIDMRTINKQHNANQWISDILKNELLQTFAKQEQSLLFLNRRGYAPLTLCSYCGAREECDNCSTWLINHKQNSQLQCHYCNFTKKIPIVCSNCHKKNSFIAVGPGIERIADEVKTILPQARVSLMSSDSFDNTEVLLDYINEIKNGNIDVIIGTQIMAKGHHFAKLNLVGVIDADASLAGGDLRVGEKTFQLLQQVAGRCGRELTNSEKGKVFLQTYLPDNLIMQALVNADKQVFFEQELAMRKLCQMPPYSKLVSIICSSLDANLVESFIKRLRQIAPPADNIIILGPVKAELAILRKYYRWRLLVKAPKNYYIQKYISNWLHNISIPKALKLQIDIDPISFH